MSRTGDDRDHRHAGHLEDALSDDLIARLARETAGPSAIEAWVGRQREKAAAYRAELRSPR